MKPRKPSAHEPQKQLFRVERIHLIDLDHPLVKLAGLADGSKFDAAFEPLFDDQPATRRSPPA